jgi:hypothetical protein
VSRITPLLLLAVLFASCGTGQRERDAASASNRFHSALAEGDGAAACGELSEQTRTELEQSEGALCAEAILALDLPAGARSATTEVYVTSAFVRLSRAGSVFLDEVGDRWRVSAAGCRAPAGDRPWSCELEG